MYIYHEKFIKDNITYYLGATDVGLLFLATNEEMFGQFLKKYKIKEILYNKEITHKYIKSLTKYLSKEIFLFDFKYDLRGTEFQKSVWKELCSLKYGETITYKQLAKKINRENSVRAVANAVATNSVLVFIPCHRVIASSGKLCGYRGGLPLKKYLLDLEHNS